jgi:hypothetical protein
LFIECFSYLRGQCVIPARTVVRMVLLVFSLRVFNVVMCTCIVLLSVDMMWICVYVIALYSEYSSMCKRLEDVTQHRVRSSES